MPSAEELTVKLQNGLECKHLVRCRHQPKLASRRRQLKHASPAAPCCVPDVRSHVLRRR